jgi:DNA mismatch endonuclease, patch repair protein
MDTRSPEQRSRIMRAVGTANTGPELRVRRLLHALGYRYRLHVRTLPGRPDLLFPSRRKVILIHGCFWHGHGCSKGRLPKSRLDYWGPKIEANQRRDDDVVCQLEERGWQTLVIWQCETKDVELLRARLVKFLDSTPQTDRLSNSETLPSQNESVSQPQNLKHGKTSRDRPVRRRWRNVARV